MVLRGERPPAGAQSAPALPPRLLTLFVGALTLVGAVTFAVVVAISPPWSALAADPSLYAILVAALVLGEIRPILIPRGDDTADQLTISTTFAIALLVVGPVSLAIAVQVAAVVLDDLRTRRPWHKICFNAAQYVLSMVVARAVFDLVGGPDFSGHAPLAVGDVVPALVAGAVFVTANYLLVALVVALDTGEPIGRVVAADAGFTAVTSSILVSLAPLAVLLAELSPWMLMLLLLPLVAVHFGAAQAMRREHQALHDSLTGLGNRELFHARAGRLLGDRGGGDTVAVLLVGLERFDNIRDTLGHGVADDVLLEVSRRLRSVVNDDEQAARVGDQFVVLAPGGQAPAEDLARTLLRELDTPVELGDVRFLIQANVGIAVAPEHGTDTGELLKNAGVALHDPTSRRGLPNVYRPEADVGTLERLQLLSELRTAIDERQFVLVYQPQVEVATGLVVGAEALVRWQHPVRGTVMPDAFIALAENSGLIAQVTDVVLDEALRTTARLLADGHTLRMSVNMSARHMSDLSLPATVAQALARHRVPPSALTLEVTETGMLSEPARVDAVVRELRGTGVSIAVDDYGTGQASLNYLKRLVVDELKIDKSFVIDMRSDTGDAIIVRSTIELGHDLGLRIVAEGVEDEDTLVLLRGLGSDVAQGWHLGRPMTETKLSDVLQAQRSALGPAESTGPAGPSGPLSSNASGQV